jgi:transcriptional regulator GlxA family with amidase domain
MHPAPRPSYSDPMPALAVSSGPKSPTPLSPRDVKYAIQYMEANLEAPITLDDILEVAGVPGRTLFKHFHDWRGISPMRYLRNARFRQAREALRRAGPEATVTEIAMNCGFAHMGRFSVEYRKRFGESPSETLRRGRTPAGNPGVAAARTR